MGEKTTIEIENMRELKQHALDTDKTLKQIINEAISEKIARERKKLGISSEEPKDKSVGGETLSTVPAGDSSGIASSDNEFSFEPEIIAIINKVLSNHDIEMNNISSDSWSDELESDIKNALETVYDETVSSEVIQKLKAQK
jgi:hypothetical protein